jgi:hypothetical protein
MFFNTIKEISKKSYESLDQILKLINLSSEKETVTYEELRQKIRELAYIKSEEDGHPWGQDKEFWLRAEKELFFKLQ